MIATGKLKNPDMNRTEAAYALVLEARRQAGEVAWWEFEGITMKLADDTRYTPDFAVMLANGEMEMHETKGFMRDDAWVKLKIAAKQFPFRFWLVRKERVAKGGGWNSEVVG